MRNIIIFAIIGMLLFGCINPPQPGNNTTTSQPTITNGTPAANGTAPANNTPASNATTQPANQSPPALPADYTVNLGDNVSVIYALYVNGTLSDTNNATLANESGIYNPNRRYVPLDFTAQFGSGMIDGFVLGVIGMKVNETLAFQVDPGRGYGFYDPGKVLVVPRYYNQSMTEVVPMAYFTERHLNVSNGTSFNTPYGYVFVRDFNDQNVTIYYAGLVEVGYQFTYLGIPNQVAASNVDFATIERMLEVNRTYVVADPQTGQPARFTVTEKTGQNITLDGNPPLANKTLDFVVTLLSVTPAPHD
ncbi:FKBP-type peptidyl-prolyl cis-trans isomerase [Candidatus Micrarchaeota archaeon]|nr:FKBP-type peptidyl-prolyl cis-trans isomerase [Candidatus Micrarchaeota archaeon]